MSNVYLMGGNMLTRYLHIIPDENRIDRVDDPELKYALFYYHQIYMEHHRELEKVNFREILREGEKHGVSVHDWLEAGLEKAAYDAEAAVKEYIYKYNVLYESFVKLHALSLLLEDDDPYEKVIGLRDVPDYTRVRTIMYKSWAKERAGSKLSYPQKKKYLLEPMISIRSKFDEEYATLSYLLEHAYNSRYRGRLLKRESPDFLYCNGNSIGIEVTQALPITDGLEGEITNLNERTHKGTMLELAAEYHYRMQILPVLKDIKCSMLIHARPTWRNMKVREWRIAEDAKDQYNAMVAAKGQRKKCVLRVEDSVLSYELYEDDYISIADVSELPYAGLLDEKLCANSIYHAINMKLSKAVPEIEPSILVVYPNMRRGHYDVMEQYFADRYDVDISSHYSEVWYACEQHAAQLLPK